MPDDNPTPLDIFEAWALYECIVAQNYMRHVELIDAITPHALQLAEPLRVWDLGCGDGYLASHVLKDAMVESYVGVDLSASGLERAAERLGPIAARVETREQDIRTAVGQPTDPQPNFLLASFSLHHYPVDEQQQLATECHRLLSEGGLFVWIDARRGPEESREDYLRRFHEVLLPSWTALSAGQMQEVRDHMNEADYPASDEEKLAMAAAAGFAAPDALYVDDYFSAHLFRKS